MIEIKLTNSDKVALIDDGQVASLAGLNWNLDKDGYARRSVRQGGTVHNIRMHRAVMGLTWADNGQDVDHINFNRLDNRRENLRLENRSKPDRAERGNHMSWQEEHLERQERLDRAIELELISESDAELLDAIDNKMQELLVKACKKARWELCKKEGK